VVWGGEGGPGFFDDGWRSAGVGALAERGGGEEFGVAVGAVARAEEVEEAVLADGDGGWGGGFGGRRCWRLVVCCWLRGYRGLSGDRDEIQGFFAPLRMTTFNRGRSVRGGSSCRRWWRGGGLRVGCGRGLEGLKGDLEGVDELTGAAGVDGVLGEAVDDGGEGDEDGGAILDWRQLHAGELGIDEDTVVFAVGLLDVVVVAIIFAFECGRAAALAGWSLVVVAVVVACEVWQWLRHGYPPGYRFCMIFQTNHLRAIENTDHENKGLSFHDLQNAGVMVSLELVCVAHLDLGRHKPGAGGFCLYLDVIIRGVSSGEVWKCWGGTH
jgi:hypothetical protein